MKRLAISIPECHDMSVAESRALLATLALMEEYVTVYVVDQTHFGQKFGDNSNRFTASNGFTLWSEDEGKPFVVGCNNQFCVKCAGREQSVYSSVFPANQISRLLYAIRDYNEYYRLSSAWKKLHQTVTEEKEDN